VHCPNEMGDTDTGAAQMLVIELGVHCSVIPGVSKPSQPYAGWFMSETYKEGLPSCAATGVCEAWSGRACRREQDLAASQGCGVPPWGNRHE